MTDRADEEERRCTCGAGHGSLEGHLPWCDWLEPAARPFTDAQIKHMVDRFLCWKLPDDFAPDAGVSFKRLPHGMPIGTNILTATQAETMVRNMLVGIPTP